MKNSSHLFSEVFQLPHQFLRLFVTHTFLSWSCDETTGNRIQSTGKGYPLLYVSLQYCSLQEYNLRALSDLCSTARIVQYEQFIPALEVALLVVLRPPHISRSLAVSS